MTATCAQLPPVLGTSRVWNALHAQLLRLAQNRGTLVSHSETPWTSITFSGSRHEVVLRFEGIEAIDAGEAMIAALPDHEFSIAGQLVADATVTATDHVFGEVETLSVTATILLLEYD